MRSFRTLPSREDLVAQAALFERARRLTAVGAEIGGLSVLHAAQAVGAAVDWASEQAFDLYAASRHDLGLPLSDRQMAMVATGARSYAAILEQRLR